MAREINPVCNFFFGFMHTNLPSDMVDVDLTIRTVQEIYTYQKELQYRPPFLLCGVKVWPFPSLRKKIKAFKEDSRRQKTLTWTPQISTPTKPPQNPRKHAPGKVRTWWSNQSHHFKPIKTNRFDTLGTNLMGTNKISLIKPIPQKSCEHFGATCSFCRQQAPHPLLSNWIGQVKTGMAIKLKPGGKILYSVSTSLSLRWTSRG